MPCSRRGPIDPRDSDGRALRPQPRHVLRPLHARKARGGARAGLQPHRLIEIVKRLVVIGGGISGTAAAFRAKKRGGLLRAAREPFVPARRDESDESVWDFAARRLGPEFADRLIHPMVLGIFAGDAKRPSLPAAVPVMAELEREHGSLV